MSMNEELAYITIFKKDRILGISRDQKSIQVKPIQENG